MIRENGGTPTPAECRKDICSYTFDEYVNMVKAFHGYAAPGVLIGGFMVDAAYRHLPEGHEYDVVCETTKCLPDAAQLLTPCTIGNGWLTILNLGRYAITLYDKHTGQGVRVAIDAATLDKAQEIKAWFLKLKPKKEQDEALLDEEIRNMGAGICSISQVTVNLDALKKRKRSSIAVCPECKEAYPREDGELCRGCQGEAPYHK
jgi:formylmethanofuran dehydrogenase subunit E